MNASTPLLKKKAKKTKKSQMHVSQRCIYGALSILLLSLAVEVLYLVPYGLPGSFRPMFRQAFSLSNTEVGRLSSIYGVVNLCLYAPGGYIADRFQPKASIASALLVTAAGAAYLTIMPSFGAMFALWAVLAVAGSIFWSSFVAAIRQIGRGEDSGKAFGFEQFSRGILSSLLTLLLTFVLGKEAEEAANTEHPTKMATLLYMLAALASATALATWCFLPTRVKSNTSNEQDADAAGIKNSACDEGGQGACSPSDGLSDTVDLLRQPAVWLHALIVAAAYCANLATGYFAGFAKAAYGFDNLQAAQISTLVTWTRAFVGLLAGLAADNFGRTRICTALFVWTICAYAWVALLPIDASRPAILVMQITSCAAGAYGIAGVYFTLLDDAQLPLHLTGAAVGTISIVGFTPDIFLGQVAGYWLDTYPGAQGYQYFYGIIACMQLLGLLATLCFACVVRSRRASDTDITGTS
eukprot:TRINITY_DN14300_c0_g1_i1.p1 TRINITY_DN14300_c0_g1~~TRINITY_DN14300_c0_g1_i1.p1  ORF type:complete len:468 (+),score=83.88 TRINITY_DN14300_c0_g1_i1:114-1517(+)